MDKRRLDNGTVLVGFELPSAVSATSVSVCGDFNDWAPRAHELQVRQDGSFRTEISLPAGDRVRFRYLLDGQRWENDWAADDYIPNGLGDDDSVVDLTHPQGLPLLAAAAQGRPDPTGSDAAGGTGTTETPVPRPGLLRRWWRRLTGPAAA